MTFPLEPGNDETPHVTLLRADYRTAGVDIRERLAIAEEQLSPALRALAGRFGGAVIVGTCNRLEIYVPGDRRREEVIAALVHGGLGATRPWEYLEVAHGLTVVRHLFAVAAGIDSMVLGESEIARQMRDAVSAAEDVDALDGTLGALFTAALRAGRRVRRETSIGRHALSLSSVAAEQAQALHPDLPAATVLVLGSGKAGQLAAEALASRGVGQLIIANRTYAHAEALARRLFARALPLHQVESVLDSVDIVIGAAEGRLTLPDLERRRPARPPAATPLILIDLGVPRCLDPGLRAIPGILYRDIDDLSAAARANGQRRASEVGRVNVILGEELDRFLAEQRTARAIPLIAAITSRAEELRRAELAKSLRRIAASEAQREALDALTRALVKQLLHAPLASLREWALVDDHRSLEVARALFRLDGAGFADEARPPAEESPAPQPREGTRGLATVSAGPPIG